MLALFQPHWERPSPPKSKLEKMDRQASLRERMLSHLERNGTLRAAAVANAMRAVPRHRFLPGFSIEEAYADRAIAIKLRDDEVVSSISQPSMIAQMLELLAPLPGDRVLEIGTGSGYNAALLAEMVGPQGHVTTVDLDGDLVESARTTWEMLGYERICAYAADGSARISDRTPYDRLVVTARSDDIAAAWWQMLRLGGRLVVPLRLEGAGEYAVGFIHREDGLRSVGVHPCAFIALRGENTASEKGDVFYRDPSRRSNTACIRAVSEILAVRREQATEALLHNSDIVIARPTTLFAIRFI
jgi:protein-L-isoaspartate(D-aspartate) O-methyltransferase